MKCKIEHKSFEIRYIFCYTFLFNLLILSFDFGLSVLVCVKIGQTKADNN